MNNIEIWHLLTIALGSLSIGCVAVGIMFTLQNNLINKRIDDMSRLFDKRIDDTNRRIDDTNRRIDEIRAMFMTIFGDELKKIMEKKTGTHG